MNAASLAIAQDAAALRQGAEGPDAGEEEEEEEEDDDLSDSDDDEEPPKPPPPPVQLAKCYAIPRDFKRVVEVQAELVGKNVTCKAVGPDFGDAEKSGSKYVHACKAAKKDVILAVPYDGRKVLSINMRTGEVK